MHFSLFTVSQLYIFTLWGFGTFALALWHLKQKGKDNLHFGIEECLKHNHRTLIFDDINTSSHT
jgi:hypothetical protein